MEQAFGIISRDNFLNSIAVGFIEAPFVSNLCCFTLFAYDPHVLEFSDVCSSGSLLHTKLHSK